MKKICTLLLVLSIFALLFSGCGTTAAPASATTNGATTKAETTSTTAAKPFKIGFAVMDMANPFFVQVAEGYKSMGNVLNYESIIVDCKMDAATQISAIENFISQKVNAIVVSPVDSKAVEPLVKKAQDAGIPFVCIAQDVPGYDAWIQVPELDYGLAGGRMAGEWMKKNLTGPVEVAILDLPELKQIIDRARGLEEGILEMYPEAIIVAHQSASTPETGMKAAETILQAHPNVKIIAAINDAGALGAAEAVKAAGKATDDFGVFGLDATPEALAKIKEGGIYRGTVSINPPGMGELAAKTAYDLANGVALSEKVIKVVMIPVME